MEGEEASIHFNCFVHYPTFTEEGLEVENVAKGNGIELHPSTQLSSLAASVLSEMFQKQEIDGKVIMKADNAKGQWRCFAFFIRTQGFKTCMVLNFERFFELVFLVFLFNRPSDLGKLFISLVRNVKLK